MLRYLGLRTQKVSTDVQTSATITTQYVYNGSLLVAAKISNGINMYFLYDATGEAIGFDYDDNGTVSRFYYQRLITGEIVGILSRSGTQQVEYVYDAWGNILTVSGTLATTVGYYNPLKYKGYVYDEETKLYYLQSRYYDPQVTRFLNADTQLNVGQSALGANMFAYCLNNPVSMSDASGHIPSALQMVMSAAGKAAAAMIAARLTTKQNPPVVKPVVRHAPPPPPPPSVKIPQGGDLGTFIQFMGYHKVTNPDSPSFALKLDAVLSFEYSVAKPEYYAMIDGRTCIATTYNIGNQLPLKTGDYVDVEFQKADGTIQIYPCIIAVQKNPSDPGMTEWGHKNGQCVVEIIYLNYSPPEGYNANMNDPWGTGRVISITKVGSYYS